MQDSLNQMCDDAKETRDAMGNSLKSEYGEDAKEIIDALIENDKDQFLMEWDLLEYEKIKKFTDKLITDGIIQLNN